MIPHGSRSFFPKWIGLFLIFVFVFLVVVVLSRTTSDSNPIFRGVRELLMPMGGCGGYLTNPNNE
jgi:hypothetical protein